MAQAEHHHPIHLQNRCLITEAVCRDRWLTLLYLLIPVLPPILAFVLEPLSLLSPPPAGSWLGLSWYASGILFVVVALIAYRRYEGAVDFAGWLVAGCVTAIMALSAAGAMGVASAPKAALGLWAVVVLGWLWSTWAHHRAGNSAADRRWQSSAALLGMLALSVMLLVASCLVGVVLADEVLHRACGVASGIAIGFALLFALVWVHTPAATRAGVEDAAGAEARRLARYAAVARWSEQVGLGLRMLALWLVLGVMIVSAAQGPERLLTACCYAVVAGLVLSFTALAVSGIYGSMSNGPRRQGH